MWKKRREGQDEKYGLYKPTVATTAQAAQAQLPETLVQWTSSAILDSFRIAIAKSESLPFTLEQAFSGVDYGRKGEGSAMI